MDRIPSALELSPAQIILLRNIVANSFIPSGQANGRDKARLLVLALVQERMGGLVATPAGRIVARL
jgi:hypothetical protein